MISVREENRTNPNEIGRVLQNLVGGMGEIMNKNRPVGQRTDVLEPIMKDLSNVISKKTLEHFGNNAKNQTMGLVGSRVEIGGDARNLGLRLEQEIAKREPRQTKYSPRLVGFRESGLEMSPGSKVDFRGRRIYSEREFFAEICNVRGIFVKSMITENWYMSRWYHMVNYLGARDRSSHYQI